MDAADIHEQHRTCHCNATSQHDLVLIYNSCLTKIAPNRIIDWVDQALLLMVLPPQTPEHRIGIVLRSNGIRTASALVGAARSLLGQPSSILESFPPDARSQVISLAALFQL
jgi:hypothetical protein